VNSKFRLLTDGALAVPYNYFAMASCYIREHTTEDDTVLSLFNQPQVLFFSARRHAGYPIIYAPGIMTSEKWRRRNLERVVRDNPAFVVTMPGVSIDNRVENLMQNMQPELWDYVLRHYEPVALRLGYLMILGRSGSGK
jgi:hypothetical protein